MALSADLKKAIQFLPEAEKDKLIFRLLRSNPKIESELMFELVDTDTVEQKRDIIQLHVESEVKRMSNRFYSPGQLMMELRYLSGTINEHVTITKDKIGEIVLNSIMIREALNYNNLILSKTKLNAMHKMGLYVISRAFKILLLIHKQHEDLRVEFRDDVQTIGKLIGENPNLMKIAIHNGFDVNWLIQFNWPENLPEIYRESRNQGYL
jgi:hypothetical protein